jgi:3-isopropylmalate/(R)-2-methylmalate dehydratase small subunit
VDAARCRRHRAALPGSAATRLRTCPGCEAIAEGERIAFDARAGTVTRASGEVLRADPIPGFLLEMVEAGGLLPQLKRRFERRIP